MTCGVYQIQNVINYHRYIGSSINIEGRISGHSRGLERNCHSNMHLQRAFNKYGEDSFEYDILMICDLNMLSWYEQRCLDKFKPEYNIATDTISPMRGKKFSEKYRNKISKSLIGNKNMLGHRHTEESRKKMSEVQKGHPPSNNKGGFTGHKHNDETKKKLSLMKIGHIHSDETKKKISEARKHYWIKRNNGKLLGGK